jgi:NAD(P)-dependent dehydrogenase (short-subunit alcohol dehydrogenase family)
MPERREGQMVYGWEKMLEGKVAVELGKHGIAVNALVPGLIDTALTRHQERYA